MVFLCLIAATAVWLETRPIRNEMVRASTYQNIGRVLDDQNKLDEAFTYYAKARDLWPADPLVHILLGRIRLDQNKPAEALPYFIEAVRLAPNDAPAHVAYGAGLLAAGQADAAAAEFHHALEIDPQNPRAQEGLRQARSRRNTDNSFRL